ncbi:KinB-signaling pathway activation protein [Bacillus massilinigeriensis]|uniref:KinB-signaling pathway activation protein n=1 Tax=Bacillus massilionigeriensis TaxID=1805475 RepID=UPI00096AF716|nr:KinB-signaling pathway activation protein [Bacillus massilionigeriensis]
MTSRNWVRFFLTTLLIGALTTGIVGMVVRWNEFVKVLSGFNIVGMLSIFLWLFGVGLIFSLLSQMGFFAYLTIHRFGLGLFRSVKLWNAVQIIFILFTIFDLVYMRYSRFAQAGDSILPYIGVALLILVIGLAVAYFKAKQTNMSAFVPAVFFMVVITILEWVPVLRINKESWFYIMLFALLACNAYQLLTLHKVNEKSEQQRKSKSIVQQGKNKSAVSKQGKKKSVAHQGNNKKVNH